MTFLSEYLANLTIIFGGMAACYSDKYYYHTPVQLKNYIHSFNGDTEIALQLRFMQIP